jgi:hypothetical protein
MNPILSGVDLERSLSGISLDLILRYYLDAKRSIDALSEKGHLSQWDLDRLSGTEHHFRGRLESLDYSVNEEKRVLVLTKEEGNYTRHFVFRDMQDFYFVEIRKGVNALPVVDSLRYEDLNRMKEVGLGDISYKFVTGFFGGCCIGAALIIGSSIAKVAHALLTQSGIDAELRGYMSYKTIMPLFSMVGGTISVIDYLAKEQKRNQYVKNRDMIRFATRYPALSYLQAS